MRASDEKLSKVLGTVKLVRFPLQAYAPQSVEWFANGCRHRGRTRVLTPRAVEQDVDCDPKSGGVSVPRDVQVVSLHLDLRGRFEHGLGAAVHRLLNDTFDDRIVGDLFSQHMARFHHEGSPSRDHPAVCREIDTLGAMDVAELVVNIGLLLVSVVAAAVAWWQASQARRSGKDAQAASEEAAESRRLATKAQQDAARALIEANEIARAAQSTVGDQLSIERRREMRLTERRDVNWGGTWVLEADADTPPTLELTNIGTTDAVDVTLTMDLPQGRQSFALGNVAAGESGRAVVRDTEMAGPAAAATMARHDISIDVHWSSPLGFPEDKPGMIWGEG